MTACRKYRSCWNNWWDDNIRRWRRACCLGDRILGLGRKCLRKLGERPHRPAHDDGRRLRSRGHAWANTADSTEGATARTHRDLRFDDRLWRWLEDPGGDRSARPWPAGPDRSLFYRGRGRCALYQRVHAGTILVRRSRNGFRVHRVALAGDLRAKWKSNGEYKADGKRLSNRLCQRAHTCLPTNRKAVRFFALLRA